MIGKKEKEVEAENVMIKVENVMIILMIKRKEKGILEVEVGLDPGNTRKKRIEKEREAEKEEDLMKEDD